MNRVWLVGLTGVLLLTCLFAFSGHDRLSAQVKAPEQVTRWEYKVLFAQANSDKALEDALNKVGAEGWELAGTAVPPNQFAPHVYLICKRPKR